MGLAMAQEMAQAENRFSGLRLWVVQKVFFSFSSSSFSFQIDPDGLCPRQDPRRVAPHVRARVGRGGLRHPAGRERRLLRHDQRRHHAQPDQVQLRGGPVRGQSRIIYIRMAHERDPTAGTT